MTREEAINIISFLQADTEEANEALDMALKALILCQDIDKHIGGKEKE